MEGKGQQMDQGQVQAILSMCTPHWRAPSEIGKYQTLARHGCWIGASGFWRCCFTHLIPGYISNFCSPSLKMWSLQETVPTGAGVTRNTLRWKRRLIGELSICVPAVSSGYWGVKIILFTNERIYFLNFCYELVCADMLLYLITTHGLL